MVLLVQKGVAVVGAAQILLYLNAISACNATGSKFIADSAPFTFSLGITGDVNLNPSLTSMHKRVAPEYVWGDMIDVTRSVDVMAIQHESTLANVQDSNPATIQFEDPLNYTATYRAAGIDFLTVANNHQYDFGMDGLPRTIATLDKIGIPYGGLGWSREAVRRPTLVRKVVAGANVTVAFFTLVVDECWQWANGSLYLDGCTCGPNANPTGIPPYQCYQANDTMPGLWYQFGIDDALIADVSSVVRAYKVEQPEHLIVTYLHVGPNFQWTPYPIHEQLLRNISEAGADVVWGTSSHHIQRLEMHQGKPIVYGLGDFLFRHVVGVEDWCPLYARPCEAYRPDLSLVYVFDFIIPGAHHGPNGSADSTLLRQVPTARVGLKGITAYGTVHNDTRTQIVTKNADVDWLRTTFGRVSAGDAHHPKLELQKTAQGGKFTVSGILTPGLYRRQRA